MYLSPPSAQEVLKTSDWIRMRQCGIRYDLAEGDQRIVDKHFIIKPRVEFEVKCIFYVVSRQHIVRMYI